jgi:hypothetical protein
MRLTEFADPNLYYPPANDTLDFADELRRSWADRSAGDLASTMQTSRNQTLATPRKLLDEL